MPVLKSIPAAELAERPCISRQARAPAFRALGEGLVCGADAIILVGVGVSVTAAVVTASSIDAMLL
jgi:hypothetical protein